MLSSRHLLHSSHISSVFRLRLTANIFVGNFGRDSSGSNSLWRCSSKGTSKISLPSFSIFSFVYYVGILHLPCILQVKPGTQPGQKVVLRGKGIKTRNSSYYGDQYVHFNVNIPANLTPRQRVLIEEFAKEEQAEEEKDAKAAGASG
jgi:hypothetical protein